MPVRCTTVSWSLERTLLVSNRFMTPKPAAKDGNVSTARCLKIQCGVGAGHGSGPAQPNLVLSTRHNASQHMKMMPHASSQPAKRRGRPRKQQSSVPETTTEVDAHTDSSLKPRGRRGRPPKIRQGDESGREATAGADVLHSSSDSSRTVSPRHRKQTLMSALANTPMHAQTHPSPMQHVHQPVQSMYSAPVAAAATTPLLPVSEQELELAKQQQQQQQQVGPGQLSSAEDRLHSTTSSSSSLQYDSSSASSQGASAHFVAGNDGIQQFGHPQPNTEQYRQAMEHLFRLPDASTSGLSTSSSSVSNSSAADATAGHSAAGHTWTVRPIAEQEPGVSSKGFRVTSTVQGRGFTRLEAPGDQQQQQQDRSKSSPTNSKSSSKSSVDAEEAISVGSDQHQHHHHHHHYDHLHSLNPPEPSPLEPPVHPELQDDVELQGEQLKEHRQLLQQLQLGEAGYKERLSNPIVSSLAYLPDSRMQQLQAARQLLSEHPELHRWTLVRQQEFDRAVLAARKATSELAEIQLLISKLQGVLAQEEQRAGKLVSRRSSTTPHSTVSLLQSHQDGLRRNDGSVPDSTADAHRAAATGAASDADAGQSAIDQAAQLQAAASLEMLQRLLPQFESAGTQQQQQQFDDDSDPHEDYQWG